MTATILQRETATYAELHALLARYAVRHDRALFDSAFLRDFPGVPARRFRYWTSQIIVTVPKSEESLYAVFQQGDAFTGFQHLFDAHAAVKNFPDAPLYLPASDEVFCIVDRRDAESFEHAVAGGLSPIVQPDLYQIVLEGRFAGVHLTGRDAPTIRRGS